MQLEILHFVSFICSIVVLKCSYVFICLTTMLSILFPDINSKWSPLLIGQYEFESKQKLKIVLILIKVIIFDKKHTNPQVIN